MRTEKELLLYITQNEGQDKSAIPLSMMISAKDWNVRPAQLFRLVFRLLSRGAIRLSRKKRFPTELFICLREKSRNKESLISHMVDSVAAYAYLELAADFKTFHKKTRQQFKDLPLLAFLEEAGASFESLEILCKYIDAYFSDDMPMSLHDLGLSRERMIHLSDELMQSRCFLQNQLLLDIRQV